MVTVALVCASGGAAERYVAVNGAHVPPFNSWAKAATNIQAAVDVAVDGDTVLVTNGVYALGERVAAGYASSNRVVITKDIEVRSVNGPRATMIVGQGPVGDAAVRCVYLSAGMLSGFTLTNGHTRSDGTYDRSGGGVSMYYPGGMVSNCIMIGNVASYVGGGVYFGAVKDCLIIGNRAAMGGGLYGCVAYGCTISGNSANTGGGMCQGTVHNCVICDNTATDVGGGTHQGSIYNSLIIKNMAGKAGGGVGRSFLQNCTVAHNTATNRGGGIYSDYMLYGVKNCIVYFNRSVSDAATSNWYLPSYCELMCSCAAPLVPGWGNIVNNPEFINAAAGDYRLAESSPCINAGTNDAGMAWQTDLDGNSRILPVGGGRHGLL